MQNLQQLSSKYSLNIEATKANFGKATVKRGIEYFTQKRVEKITKTTELFDGSLSVEGIVRGRQTYNTRFIFRENRGEKIPISYCNCPVGNNCKHGIALLYEFLNQNNDSSNLPEADDVYSDDAEVDEWLKKLEANENVLAVEEDEDDDLFDIEYHVVYELSHESDSSHEIVVRPHKVRLLKNGGYGKSAEVSTHDIGSYSSATVQVTDADRTILRIIRSESQRQYYTSSVISSCKIKGKLGHFLLEELLKTQRLFWKEYQSTPLTLGDTRTVLLEWKEEDGSYELDPRTSPAVDTFFLLDHLYYIDTKLGECGVAKHDSLSGEQILHFLSVPSVSKRKAQDVSRKLINILPEVDVPLPVNIGYKTVEIEDITPKPSLRLHAINISKHKNAEQLLHVASLSFDYDGLSYQPRTLAALDSDIAVVLDDKTRHRIHRDKEAELEAMETMQAQHFIPIQVKGEHHSPLDMHLLLDDIETTIAQWDVFREEVIPELESNGWNVSVDGSFNLQIELADDWHGEIEENDGGNWFELSLGFELNGKRINLLPLLVDLLSQSDDPSLLRQSLQEKAHHLFQYAEHHWVKLPTNRMLRILDTVIELYDKDVLNDDGNLTFSRHAGLHYNDLLNDASLKWKGAEELQALNKKIRDFDGIEAVDLPKGLNAELREYQKQGLNWLQFLRSYQFNGILADDMGLGKTIQTLAHLLIEKESGRAELPSLVIAPTSLMSNWKNEAKRFTKDLKVLILQGTKRKQHFANITKYDLILTTYPLILRDSEVYEKAAFHYLILDEAQAIKNAKSKTTQMIYTLKANHRLCLTGTPLENHLGEVWSMYHYLMPGYLGQHERFTRLFRTPIEKNGDLVRGQQLRQRIQPFMLRRSKEVVAKELPPKTEMIRTVPLSGAQRDLYETVRLAMDKKVRDEISKKGLARSHIMILEALLKLRQVCCDPRLVKLERAKRVTESAKLDLLMTLVPEMVQEGRKILIFSQFVSMLELIEKELQEREITYSKLTGKTQKREEAIDSFQEGDASIFLISLKAGGVGLNLTAADTVIHYDPWWNPAVERQATDRAYRIGQDKPVFVYKLFTEDTVEEKILKLQEKKQALADALYTEGDDSESMFNQEDLISLLQPIN